jgi:excisionase family DNA binding protein
MPPEGSDAARAAFAGLADLPSTVAELLQLVRRQGEQLDAIAKRLPADLVSPAEYSRRTGLSTSTVKRAVLSGGLPVLRVGRRVLIDAAAARPPSPEAIAALAREARRAP